MEEIESKNTIEEIKEYVSQMDAAQVPAENIDELDKLLARIKELAASPEHKEEIERQAEHVLANTAQVDSSGQRETETPVPANADLQYTSQPPESPGSTVPHKETSETVAQSQYKDFFTLRDNTSYNFRHNLSVYCRKEEGNSS